MLETLACLKRENKSNSWFSLCRPDWKGGIEVGEVSWWLVGKDVEVGCRCTNGGGRALLSPKQDLKKSDVSKPGPWLPN